eukprot:2273057-Amphidinium_carterae.1
MAAQTVGNSQVLMVWEWHGDVRSIVFVVSCILSRCRGLALIHSGVDTPTHFDKYHKVCSHQFAQRASPPLKFWCNCRCSCRLL